MEQLRDKLMEHMQNDERRFENIERMFTTIKDNHLFHIEKSAAEMGADIKWLKELFANNSNTANTDWLTWAVRLGMGAAVGGLITLLITKL